MSVCMQSSIWSNSEAIEMQSERKGYDSQSSCWKIESLLVSYLRKRLNAHDDKTENKTDCLPGSKQKWYNELWFVHLRRNVLHISISSIIYFSPTYGQDDFSLEHSLAAVELFHSNLTNPRRPFERNHQDQKETFDRWHECHPRWNRPFCPTSTLCSPDCSVVYTGEWLGFVVPESTVEGWQAQYHYPTSSSCFPREQRQVSWIPLANQ